MATTKRNISPPSAAKPAHPAPTTMLLVRHGQTPTTGKVLPGRAPGPAPRRRGPRAGRASPAERIAELEAGRRDLQLAARTGPGDRGADRQGARVAHAGRPRPVRVRLRRLDRRRTEEADEAARVAHRAARTVDVPVPGRRELHRDADPDGDDARRLRAAHPGGTIVCVSHADPIKAAVAHALGTHIDLFQRIVISPARSPRSRGVRRARSCSPSTRPADPLTDLAAELTTMGCVLRVRRRRRVHDRHRRPAGRAHVLPPGARQRATRHR